MGALIGASHHVAAWLDAGHFSYARITTFECPLNGLTPSIFAVAHGEIIAAFRLNPMFPVYVAILGYLIVTTTRLSFGFIDSVNAKPILAVTAATMGLTIIVKLIAGWDLRH